MRNTPPHKKSRDQNLGVECCDLDCNISPQPETTLYKFLVREERESLPARFLLTHQPASSNRPASQLPYMVMYTVENSNKPACCVALFLHLQ